MKRISAKLALAFFGMAALAVALVWLVQAVFLSDSYLNQRVATIDGAVSGVVFRIEHDKAVGKVAHVRLYGGALKNRDTVTYHGSDHSS